MMCIRANVAFTSDTHAHIEQLTAVWLLGTVNRVISHSDCALFEWKRWSLCLAACVCVCACECHGFITAKAKTCLIERFHCIGALVQCSIDAVCAFYFHHFSFYLSSPCRSICLFRRGSRFSSNTQWNVHLVSSFSTKIQCKEPTTPSI